jgi:MFS family permease
VNGAIRQPGFRNLWGGLTISLLGAQISGVALPLTAILAIGASAGELGWLGAAHWLPYLFFGLIAGVVLDRVPRREILVVTHVGRALLLLSIPLAARQSALHMEQLVVVASGVGADIPLQLSAETERLHPRLESIGVNVPHQMPQQLARLIAGLPVGVRDGLADH